MGELSTGHYRTYPNNNCYYVDIDNKKISIQIMMLKNNNFNGINNNFVQLNNNNNNNNKILIYI